MGNGTMPYHLDAESLKYDLEGKGFEPEIVISSDWTNLNEKTYYCVTAGRCESQKDAEELLTAVKDSGYTGAYVKSTGEHR